MLLFLLTGCGSTVKVNNVSIPNDQINSIVKAQELLMGKVSSDQEKALRLNVINKIIDQTLLIKEAQKRGIQVSEKDVETNYIETLKNWKVGGELKKSLKAQGYTEGNMKEMVRNQLLIQGLSDSLIIITDEQLLNHFKIHSYEYANYTILEAEGQTDTEARGKLQSAEKATILFSQLPYQIQQSIQSNKLVINEPRIINLNDKSYQAINVTSIKNQAYEDVKEKIKQSFKSQNEILKTQELITNLRSQANIKMN